MPELQVIEEWTIVDKWWTDKPVKFEYRVVVKPSGREITERRQVWPDETEWSEFHAEQ